MRILVALTYYRPHISGLTLYVERLATLLAQRGHAVTVLASRHEPELPREEVVDGVRIRRVPVTMRIGKGVVMPTLGREARRELRLHDVLSLHLPQLDASGLALNARLLRRPIVITYHCDLLLPAGALHRVAETAVRVSNHAAARLASSVVAYTDDYADHSPLLRAVRSKVVVIPPPVVMTPPTPSAVAEFRRAVAVDAGPTIGIATRLATEKGVDVLVEAARILSRRFPGLTVLFAGQHDDVPGEQNYRRRIDAAVASLGRQWRFLGPLDPVREMPAFFGAIDCLTVPSVNSTESFGLVQVEAMLCGTPVVATDLPGVRQPVRLTGMGEIVATADANALAAGLARVLDRRDGYVRPRDEITRLFDPARTAEAYEALFADVVEGAARGVSVAAAGGDAE
jgi:glycosyltransferase involved in cell wall biosynthesis